MNIVVKRRTLLVLLLSVAGLSTGIGGCMGITPDSAILNVGETVQLTANTFIEESFTWRSDNPPVASVEETGLVTAKERGDATKNQISQML